MFVIHCISLLSLFFSFAHIQKGLCCIFEGMICNEKLLHFLGQIKKVVGHIEVNYQIICPILSRDVGPYTKKNKSGDLANCT